MPAPKMDPTERFIAVLADVLGRELSDEQRVNLEDAFNDAVQAQVEERERVERMSREDW
jgi:hypothetical protein